MRFVYVALPIDRVHEVSGQKRTEFGRGQAYLREALRGHDLVGYWPNKAFGGQTPATDQMIQLNETAVDLADGMVVLWPAGISSDGIPREIERARELGTPVTAVHPAYCSDDHAIREAVSMLKAAIGASPATPPVPVDSQLQFRLTSGTAMLPTKTHADDIGWDLYAAEKVVIPVGGSADVPFDLQVAPPRGTWCRITGRSSTLRGRGLHVVEGVIDPGYRGELFAGCHNISAKPVTVAPGERIAQLILQSAHLAKAVVVDTLPPSTRGERGYGSSGL